MRRQADAPCAHGRCFGETIAEAEKSIIPEIEKEAEEDPVLADALGTFYLVYGKKREGWTEKGMALLSMAEQKEYWKASIHLGSAFNELRENPLGDADRFNPAKPSSISPLPL